MASQEMDPSLIQDFLTESGELIEQLDADLVKLEEVNEAGEAQELLNGIFRALHTIKGAASFLAMTEVTTFAHAAEDALNKLRKGEAEVTQEVMDSLLKSVDIVRGMLGEIEQSAPITPGPEDLIAQLHAIGEGQSPPPTESQTTRVSSGEAPPASPQSPTDTATCSQSLPDSEATHRPLKLSPEKGTCWSSWPPTCVSRRVRSRRMSSRRATPPTSPMPASTWLKSPTSFERRRSFSISKA